MRRIPAPDVLPTELGLRFFVDSMLQIGDVEENERARIAAEVEAASKDHDFPGVLAEATSLLSGLTRVAGVVVASKDNVRLKQIDFVRLEPERALVILVADDGSVENRVIPVAARSAGLGAHGSRQLSERPRLGTHDRRSARKH